MAGRRLLSPRRPRSNPRVIKRKMSTWHLKHPPHRTPPHQNQSISNKNPKSSVLGQNGWLRQSIP
ncbi:hypothetical protein DN051_44430 (plasmid) [Streptomyces cadmiisoli]|uniref:Uncharacterized protein n=1 Tax=Streptomyces cadmiisoli TaxID=2184053 RepID=A0A2Z4JF27_9ACTN|nr:hypothetical protein DN051_44430 [Streptomyces cadmiisoli]